MSKLHSALYYTKSVVTESPSEPAMESHWAPNTDVYLVEDGLVITVELAGIRREDLEIVMEGARLSIAGQRPDFCRGPNCRFLMMEINYGRFESVIELPPGYDTSRAKAAYQNGFLRVEVPALPEDSGTAQAGPCDGQ